MLLSWLASHLLLVLGVVLAVLAIPPLLRERRPPQATLAWLLVIVAIPYVGVPLYLIFGGGKARRLSGKPELRLRAPDAGAPNAGAQEPATASERLLRSYGIPGASGGNRIRLHGAGEESYEALIALIEQATRSLHVCTYELAADEVGAEIVARLARRAAEGVEVRLLLDRVGSYRIRRRFLAPLLEAGGHCAFFTPLLHRPFHGRANQRNHRKIVVADRRLVLSGGVNLAAYSLGPTPQPHRWPDLAFVLEGPAALSFAEVFDSDWRFATGERPAAAPEEPTAPARADGAVIQVVPSGADVRDDPLYAALLSAVHAARRRLWVVTPYFVPDEALAQALILAARRGVDVRVLVPRRSNRRFADAAARPYLRALQAAGASILLHTDGMLHAKVVLADAELAVLGTANLDMRSLLLNYEIAAFVYSRPEIEAIQAWVEGIAAQGQRGMAPASALGEFGEGFARIFAPLL